MSDSEIKREAGGKRSEVKPYYAAIPFASLRRLALRATGAPAGEIRHDSENGMDYEGGSDKYGYGNWRRGLPLEDTFNHIIEHLFRWKESIDKGEEPKEDDLAAAAWGIMLPLMTFERDYAGQYKIRNSLIAGGEEEGRIDAIAIDLFKHKGYLLQRLAPKTPAPPPPPFASTKIEIGPIACCQSTYRGQRCTLISAHAGPHIAGPLSWEFGYNEP